jgi:hypothetical protein
VTEEGGSSDLMIIIMSLTRSGYGIVLRIWDRKITGGGGPGEGSR